MARISWLIATATVFLVTACGGSSEPADAPAAPETEEPMNEAAANLARGQAFLAQNAERDGVTQTPSGLQYEVETAGDGPSPEATNTVTVHYEGTLLDGTVFDSSYQRNETISFPLNRVIAGWTEGLQLMPTGSKYKFYIPASLAYGPSGTPGGPIGPNETLIFTVELFSFE